MTHPFKSGVVYTVVAEVPFIPTEGTSNIKAVSCGTIFLLDILKPETKGLCHFRLVDSQAKFSIARRNFDKIREVTQKRFLETMRGFKPRSETEEKK